jgi:hypothetical protein
VARFPDLARQPLLLLMLALYDAGGNALQNAGRTFGTAQLYDRLLRDFALREVRRWHPDRLDREIDGLVADELMRLSVVAFAMFNRGRQWVTERELDDDLSALGIEPVRPGRTEDFRSPLTVGQEVVGRFFFIQRAQARQDGQALQTYEFLHATFGEYLVARLLADLLTENAAQEASRIRRLGTGGGEDELLRALLGYQPLTARNTVLSFVADMLAAADPGQVHAWLIGRLQAAVFRPEASPRAYGSLPKRADHWMSTYSLNLALLALACGEPLRASDIWTRAQEPGRWLQGLSLGWQAAIPPSAWFEVTAHLDVRRTYTADGRKDIVLRRYTGEPIEKVDPLWSFRTDGAAPFRAAYEMDEALRSMHLSNRRSEDVFRHAVEPLLDHMPSAVTHFTVHGPGDAESVAHSLLTLLMVSAADQTGALRRAYDRAVAAMTEHLILAPDPTNEVVLLLRTMAQDAGRLGPARVTDYCRQLAGAGFHSLTVTRAIYKCMAAAGVTLPETDDVDALIRRVEF